jgi:hypothetical protein
VTFFHCGQFNDSGTGAALALDDRPVVAAQLRIHAPTGLLFVKGDEGQVSLVREVIDRIVGQ